MPPQSRYIFRIYGMRRPRNLWWERLLFFSGFRERNGLFRVCVLPLRHVVTTILAQVRRAKAKCSSECKSRPGKVRSDGEAIPAAVELMKLPESHITIGGSHWPPH